jgi:hypothetical protein
MLAAAPGATGEDAGIRLSADPAGVRFGDQVMLEGHVPAGTRGNVQVLASQWPYQEEQVVREASIGSNYDFFVYVHPQLNTRYRLRVPEITGSEPQAEMTSEPVQVYSVARQVFKNKKRRGQHFVTDRFDFEVPQDFAFALENRPAFWYIRKEGSKRWYLKARSRTTARGRRMIARVTFRRPLTNRRNLVYFTIVCIEIEPGQDIGLGKENRPCPQRPAPPKIFHRVGLLG